jgi:hypothetical protein
MRLLFPHGESQNDDDDETKIKLERLQAHRAHLCSEYTNIARATRRALHELELATIDLRAAEMRRRVADAQIEKAKAGALGIDHVVAEST